MNSRHASSRPRPPRPAPSPRQLFSRNPPGTLPRLARACVGIAGAGGLGSNVAISLARSGVGKLILVDFDRVEASNLNRQQYRVSDVGKIKVAALKQHLAAINPFIKVETHPVRLTRKNLGLLFRRADLLIEAFDQAEGKAMLLQEWHCLFPDRYLILASGLAGYGGTDRLKVRRRGKLIVCGDERTASCPRTGLTAPRVAIVANMQANETLRILLSPPFPRTKERA